MQSDEIERDIRDLHPSAPRPGLRADVLGAMQAELSRATTVGVFDRFLARRITWAAAAVLLVGLLVSHVLLDRDHATRRAALIGAAGEIPPTARERRIEQAEDTIVAALGEEARPFVHARTRGLAAVGGEHRSLAERRAWVLNWTRGVQR